MPQIAVDEHNDAIRRRFFKLVFGDAEGYIAFAVADEKKESWNPAYFAYPQHLESALAWVNDNLDDKHHLYFSPMLYAQKRRIADNVKACPVVWCDLDEVDPDTLDLAPTISVESSPGRWHGYWVLDAPAAPKDGETASRRLAYSIGADLSGWDLSQLLRVPVTYNPKYVGATVEIRQANEGLTYPLATFLDLPDVPHAETIMGDFPKEEIERINYDVLMRKYAAKAPSSLFRLHDVKPDKDYSKALWNLEVLAFEVGMSPAEVFVLANTSESNKYKRDNRTDNDLWREVCKAQAYVGLRQAEDKPDPNITIKELLTTEERQAIAKEPPTFVDSYCEWAKSKTDAAEQYHEAGGFIILSAMLADCIRLDISNAKMVPNLWFMILGDTTLTRKTTAMEMAIDLLLTVEDEALLATDASLEGLLTALSKRPGKTSLFWRDEFSGMLEAMRRKDYMAGMAATFARLYDGKREVRVLKQATYEVHNPIFLMFCGGIKSRILGLLNEQYVIDGFLPRFIFIVAEPKIDDLRPLTLSTHEQQTVATELVERLNKLRVRFDQTQQIMIGGQALNSREPVMVSMTQEALDRYNELEREFIIAGRSSADVDLYTPTLDRLAKSALRVATLLAAERQADKEEIKVELIDVLQAIRFVEGWLPHTLTVLENVGKGENEQLLERAYKHILNGKNTRSAVMNAMHLSKRDADAMFDTLEERGFIIRTKDGKKEKVFPAHA